MDNILYTSNLSSSSHPYPSISALPIRHPERPKSSSARDPVCADYQENEIYNQHRLTSAKQLMETNFPFNGRAVSVDREPSYEAWNRGYFFSPNQRFNHCSYPSGYLCDRKPSYYPAVSLFSNVQMAGHRRAQSYDMNLERQGLYDYNNALTYYGTGNNQGTSELYGNTGSEKIDGLRTGVSLMTPVTSFSDPNGGVATYGGCGASADMANIQREYAGLHQEYEITKEKLHACMTSIRTFWSPELKRERAMRKEENAKYAILADHLHQLQLEKQTMLQALHNSDIELRREREKNASRFKLGANSDEANEFEVMQRRIDDLTCKNRLLNKSIEESENRASSLQSSLTTTEESLRRLVEAVKSGKAVSAQQQLGQQQQQSGKTDQGLVSVGDTGLANIRVDRLESDRNEIERLREQLNEAFHRHGKVEKALVESEMAKDKLKDELDRASQELDLMKHENEGLRLNTREVQTIQAIVDTQESKILTLENEIRILEDEISRLRDEGIATPTTSLSSGIEDVDRTLNTFRSNERLLKSKVEFLTSELSKRDNEIYALQSRLEMAEKQQQDQNHHINVLKEHVNARENKVAMLTADIEDLKKRLKEKEGLLEKKTKMVANSVSGIRQLETELAELKDQVDLKERKISLLQRKVEHLEETVAEKESQLVNAKLRLSRLNNEKTDAEGPKTNLEDILKEKNKQIERLKETRERSEAEYAEEMEGQRRIQSELRIRLDTTLRDLEEKNSQLSEAREEVSQLRSSRYKRDTEVNQLQAQLRQRDAEMSAIQLEKQMLQKQAVNETEMKYSKTVNELESQVNHYMESASKLQNEVDRLLSMIRFSDSDKIDKDNQLQDLNEQLHEAQNQIGSLKKAQQAERKKNTQLLDEARQRADSIQNDAELFKNIVTEKEVRVRELEQALRESVRLTAEREAHATSRDDSIRQLEHQLQELRLTVEHLQRERNNMSSQLASLQEELRDRENQLKNLETDWFLGSIPELEKLRCNNQEANLRIAALVKIVQGQEENLTEQDKLALATIPLFPSLSQRGLTSVGPLAKTQARPGHVFARLGAPGGSVSPHLSGSAFHLIGSSSASAVARAATLTAGGINLPMQSTDSLLLGRLLHEKETMLQQQLQDLTRFHFQNSEMEVKIKSLQRELDNKTARLNALETDKSTAGMSGLIDWPSQITGMSITQAELATLRQANIDMRDKLVQLQTSFLDRENELIQIQRTNSSTNALEVEKLKSELTKLKNERESIERTLRLETTRASEELARINTTASAIETELNEKKGEIKLLEFERDKLTADLENLQKKYNTILGQFTEKTDKLQQTELICAKNHLREIQRLTKESEDLGHRVSYLHKTLQGREEKFEKQESELLKQKEENMKAKKNLHILESELKSLHEEITYKDERSRQVQIQHADELSRMRSVQQEQGNKLSHLQLEIDEKEHYLKSTQGDLENTKSDLEYTKDRLQEVETQNAQINNELVQKMDRLRALELERQSQADEIARLQGIIENSRSKATILQKRVEEREQRLRKIEAENHNLLDEIHGLRKRNQELESHVDVLRQRLLDKGEQSIPPISNSPSAAGLITSSNEKSFLKPTEEADSLRKKNEKLKIELQSLKRQTQDLQIQVDQLNYERDTQILQLNRLASGNFTVDLPQSSSTDPEDANLSQKQLENEIEQKNIQIEQLTQQLDKMARQTQIPSALGTDINAYVNELKFSIQRTQQALDTANEKNRIQRIQNESALLESQQQHLNQTQKLQEQLSALQHNLNEIKSQHEPLQKEVQQSSGRIQELTRQLRETQANCDSIATQRDSLQSRLEQLQQSSGGKMPYVINGSTILGRPASVTAGYSDLMSPLTIGTSGGIVTAGGQLSRELDRLHREHEVMRGQLGIAERSWRQFKQEAETAKQEAVSLREDQQRQQEQLRETKENLCKIRDEMTKKVTIEADKYKKQIEELTKHSDYLQEQVSVKDASVNHLSHQLEIAQENCKQLEQRLLQMSQQVETLNTQQDQVALERNQHQRLSYELETVKRELSIRENQFNQLTQKLNQSLKDASDQSQVIEELSSQLEAAKIAAQQAAVTAENAHRQVEVWATEKSANSEKNQRDLEDVNTLKANLQDALDAKNLAEQKIRRLENDIQNQIEVLEAAVNRAHTAEEVCKREHIPIITKLSKENHDLQVALNVANQEPSSRSSLDGPEIETSKQEVNFLKKELNKRDVVIKKLENECQEKHVRKLEALQVQLHRYEEEASNLSRVLDEQCKGIEERDQLVRQLRTENQMVGGSADFEKLQVEHARCSQQIQQKQQKLETLMNQLEQQAEEILTTKIEALTASVCEKDANIALIKTTGPNTAASNQVLQKLNSEKEACQTQLRQLTFARDALVEQRKTAN